MKDIKEYITNVQDFPEKGILFRDITTVLEDSDALNKSIDLMVESLKDIEFDVILGPESRGFIFGVPLAYILKKGFVPVRKKGKLPRETKSVNYDLEYGSATLEIHKDSIKKGMKCVIIDDLLATGGTMGAICKLIEELGGEVVKAVFFIELTDLNGRDKLKNVNVDSIVKY